MSYRSTPILQDLVDERDCLRIELSLLADRSAAPEAIVRVQQEIARLAELIDRLRIENNSDAPRMVRQRALWRNRA
jgi:hypothetical protein